MGSVPRLLSEKSRSRLAKAQSIWLFFFGLAGIGLWLLGLFSAWEAFIFPLELEAREAAWWHQALTRLAGGDIHATQWVSCGHIGHGPMDSILKQTILRGAQALPAGLTASLNLTALNRVFVPLLPVTLALATLAMTGGKWIASFFIAGLFQLMLLSLGAFEFLVGRSDVSAEFFLVLLAWLCFWAVSARTDISKILIDGAAIMAGFLAAICTLVLWRFAPGVLLVFLLACAEMPKGRRWRFPLVSTLAFIVFVLAVLARDFQWGFARSYLENYVFPFRGYPPKISWESLFIHIHRGLGWAYLTLIAGAAYLLVSAGRGWYLLGLKILAVGLFFLIVNLGAGSEWGGYRYYGALFPAIWLFFLLAWRRVPVPGIARISAFTLLLFGAALVTRETWLRPLLEQISLMQVNGQTIEKSFIPKLKQLTAGERVYSEDLIYFHGLIRNGAQEIPWRGHGAPDSSGQHYAALEKSPPRFIISSTDDYCLNAGFSSLLKNNYEPLLKSPYHFFYNSTGSGTTLYELRKRSSR